MSFSQLLTLAVLPAFVSFIIAYVATLPAIRIFEHLKLVDDPKNKKHPKVIHTHAVPRSGGVPILFAILLSSLIFLPMDKHLIGIMIGAFIVVIIGVLDDKYDINPYIRILTGFLAASAPIVAGIGISYISNPAGGIFDLSVPRLSFHIWGEMRSIWILSDMFALFWLVFLMNMLNMGAKGVDGQLPGVATIAATTIAIFAIKFSADITQWPVIIFASIVAGSFLGFLPWNVFPQKIMPGYSGSTLAGYLLAVLSILATTKVGILLVVLGIPIVDTGYTMVRRILAGKSPVWGDTGHLHHHLLRLGFSKSQVSYFYWASTALLGAIVLNLNTYSKLYTIGGVTIFVGGLILWITYRVRSLK